MVFFKPVVYPSLNLYYFPTFKNNPSTHPLPSKMKPTVLILLLPATPIFAGPLAYGICQAGCASVVMACYAAAGEICPFRFPHIPGNDHNSSLTQLKKNFGWGIVKNGQEKKKSF